MDKDELLKKYAQGTTTKEETDEARRYLSDNFELIFDVIEEMRNNAKDELLLSSASDPIAALIDLKTKEERIPLKSVAQNLGEVNLKSRNSLRECSMKDILTSLLLEDNKNILD